MPFLRHANHRAVRDTGWHLDGNSLRSNRAPMACARRAHLEAAAARATAGGAGLREDHVPAGPAGSTGRAATLATRLRHRRLPRSPTDATGGLPRHHDLTLDPAHGVEQPDR